MKNIVVIIPTRNRPNMLLSMVRQIENQSVRPLEIIIIDSSNIALSNELFQKTTSIPIRYVHTEIRSASSQRNIGLNLIQNKDIAVAFLDDDLIIKQDYLETLSRALLEHGLVGVSGVAHSSKAQISTKAKFGQTLEDWYKRLFLLSSKREGVLLSSGIAVPVKRAIGVVKVDWLIGCSMWNFQYTYNFRFPEGLRDTSLGEDVMYSANINNFGELAVVVDVEFTNLEASTGRLSTFSYWKAWVVNRRFMRKYLKLNSLSFFAQVWAETGQICIQIMKSLKSPLEGCAGILGIIVGELEGLKCGKAK